MGKTNRRSDIKGVKGIIINEEKETKIQSDWYKELFEFCVRNNVVYLAADKIYLQHGNRCQLFTFEYNKQEDPKKVIIGYCDKYLKPKELSEFTARNPDLDTPGYAAWGDFYKRNITDIEVDVEQIKKLFKDKESKE